VLLIAGMTFGPSLLLWTIPLGLALGPAIVREREDRTWELLRTTPLDLESLLLGKIQGSLWWLRNPIRTLHTIILLAGLLVTGATLMSNTTLFGTDCETACQFLLWGWVPFSLLLFVLDRMQQFALMIVVALAASSSSRTTRTGLVTGSLATFAVWLAEIGVGVLVLAAYPGQPTPHWAIPITAMVALGPIGGYLLELRFSLLVVAILATLALREIAFRWAWRYVMCTAGRCADW
jgi:ABC-type Na+ efflux pump permease subunit